MTALASLTGGEPLLARALTDRRNVYFCTTTADPGNSSLARDGVVLYVMIQRALSAGAASLGTAQQFIAGQAPAEDVLTWRPLSDSGDALSTSYNLQPGVYEAGERLIAINRGVQEDLPARVADTRVAELFNRLEFDRVDDRAGSGTSLMEEIWRMFLALMMAALLLEAILCIPKLASSPPPALSNRGAVEVSTNGRAAAGVSA
jgi:hypothetical protein